MNGELHAPHTASRRVPQRPSTANRALTVAYVRSVLVCGAVVLSAVALEEGSALIPQLINCGFTAGWCVTGVTRLR